jgi:Holliday junction DNA helicase RuvA
MIGRLIGKVILNKPGEIILDVSGVGYLVNISYITYYKIADSNEEEIPLLIHTHAREDALTLFGFINELEKDIFLKLISLSGIGPRLAITILSGIPSEEFLDAIKHGAIERLISIPGVGKKTAERIFIEMKDKIGDLIDKSEAADIAVLPTEAISLRDDVVSALTNLGYKYKESEMTVSKILGESPGKPEFEDIFRKSLSSLAGGMIK